MVRGSAVSSCSRKVRTLKKHVLMPFPGAFSSAVSSSNQGVCSISNASSVQQSGEWTTGTVDTSIAGTTARYLTSTVSVANLTYPAVIFYPQVSSSGYYDVYIVIPGCSDLGDCGGRTSVDIEVFPVQGALGWTSTISEQLQYDTKTLVYSGPVDASSGSFTPTISLSLSKSPLTAASGDNYTIVAEAVELVLTGVTTDGSNTNPSRASGTAGINGTTIGNSTQLSNPLTQIAFGVFEWSRSSESTVNAATSLLSNSSENGLSRLGFVLDIAYNSSSLPTTWIVNAVVEYANTAYVVGDFAVTGNYSNVLAVDTTSGTTTALASQGLNGPVSSAAVIGNYLYFGGDFTSTAASDGVTLNHLARYDPEGDAWAPLGGGVDGIVLGLIPSSSSSTQLIVLGNFSNALSSDGTSRQTGGIATWDASKSAWMDSGAVFGNISAAALPSSSSTVHQDNFLVGRVSGASSNPASGVVILSSDSDGSATIASLNNVNFGSIGSASAPSSSAGSRRSLSRRRASHTRSWISRITTALVARATPVLQSRVNTAPVISVQASLAPAVLTGGFWTNSSASGKPTVTILGGNFTSGSGSNEVEGIAFYTSGGVTGPNPSVQGIVRALEVNGNTVYIGGTGVNVTGVGSDLVVYNLDSASWMIGVVPSLHSASDNVLNVNAIKARAETSTVIVAGSFASAGSLSCAAVCLWDTSSAQWSSPGVGLASGEVRAVDFADESSDIIIVVGSFVMSDGTEAFAASYSFVNSTWTALGTLPGPALSVAVDNKNASNVFAAGYSTSDASPYLQQWNGQTWTSLNQSLLSGSVIEQLAFVPMSSQHTAVGSIENDRMLLVSGRLYLESTDNVTSALYDGAQWYPYLVGSSSTGDLAFSSQLFWSTSSFSFKTRNYLAKGLVVLVAIAIATGLILLFVILALLIAFLTRRSERHKSPHPGIFEKDDGSEVSSTHQHVFNNVQAALEQSLIGVSATAAIAAARASGESYYGTAQETEDSEEAGEEGRETTMRYNFEGPELQPGELSMSAGRAVIILDDVQSDEWWYARDPETGKEGVVPATYGQSLDSFGFTRLMCFHSMVMTRK